MIRAVNQAAYLLKRQLESQSRQFLSKGGFTEKLYGARKRSLKSDASDTSDGSDTPRIPACPNCNRPMLLRTARTGPKRGQQFWGCSTFPNCKGTLPAGGQ